MEGILELQILATVLVLVAIILINIFFGYWRSNTRRLSCQWIMAIHLPVPIAIALRLSFLGWNWLLLPVFIGAFAVGQFSGGQVRVVLKKQELKLSSFLAADLYRSFYVKRRKNTP